MEMEPVESGATLIITPSTILHQWVEEIQKHIHNTNIRFDRQLSLLSFLASLVYLVYSVICHKSNLTTHSSCHLNLQCWDQNHNP